MPLSPPVSGLSPSKSRCGATTHSGSPCRAWAVRGCNPPRRAAHGGGARPVGASPGNQNALKHGFCGRDPQAVTIDDAIGGLVDKLNRIDALIAFGYLPSQELIRLFELYTQASGRLGRLLRSRRPISGDAADGLSSAVVRALEEVAEILGVDGGL